jgi:hypothetical protein
MFGNANGAVYVECRVDVTRLRRSTTPLGGAALSPLQMHPLTKDRPGGCASPKTITWSKHSRRIDLINRSAKPFCQGEAGAIGLSRMPTGEIEEGAGTPPDQEADWRDRP